MYGAILGDIIGSSHEWRRIKTERFELFDKFSKFTDDTVMTIATADAILNGTSYAEAYHKWGNRYPNAGYGGMFRKWLASTDMKPYGSFGNGSAMRVAPVAWGFKTIEEVLEEAKKSAECTHNHIEGIKGAQAVAAAIFLATEGCHKDDIQSYIESNFGYNLSRRVAEIRGSYDFDATCQGSVPESIICFLEGSSFEDTVRKAVSLGGDADTQACIAGSIAEAMYGIPIDLEAKLNIYLKKDMFDVLDNFFHK